MMKRMFVGAILLMAGLFAPPVFAGDGIVSLYTVNGLTTETFVQVGHPVRFVMRYTNNTGTTCDVSTGFRLQSPDGATWDSTTIDSVGPFVGGKAYLRTRFNIVYFRRVFSGDGQPPDTVGFLGAGIPSPSTQLPSNFDDSAFAITAWFSNVNAFDKHICIDSSFFPPGGTWVWIDPTLDNHYPTFQGVTPSQQYVPNFGYCFLISDSVKTASVLHVPGDYGTIQAAINAAIDGDTVVVSPGQYNENIRFLGKNILVTSLFDPDSTMIKAADPSKPVVLFSQNEPKGATLRGFTITGSAYGGIECLGSSPTIIGNHIVGNRSSKSNNGAGVSLKNTSGSLIRGNIIAFDTAAAYGPGIHVGDDGKTSSFDTVCYNVFYGNIGIGDIRALGHVTNLSIFNNTLTSPTFHSIGIQATGTEDIRNNIITGSVAYGIWVNDYPSVATVSYNCVFGNPHDFLNVTMGPGNIALDPQFAAPGVRDYRLQATSPCINTGDPSPVFNDPDGSRNDMGALPFVQGPPQPELLNLVQWKKSDGGNDHWYGIYAVVTNFEAARQKAATMIKDSTPWHLATITSPQENQFLMDHVLAGTNQPQHGVGDQFYLGGVYLDTEWTWLTGEPFGYVNWAPGEPNNFGIENAMAIFGPNNSDSRRPFGFWNNVVRSDSTTDPINTAWSLFEWEGQQGGGQDPIPTNEWIILYCPHAFVDSSGLVPGMVLTAYDPQGVLCGKGLVDTTGKFGPMLVYADDPYTAVDEGAQPGDVISFKLNGQTVFPTPPVIWTRNGDVFQVCNFQFGICQQIPLHTGWNLVSWNVSFDGPTESLIAGIKGCVDLMLGFDQGGLVYLPNLPEFSTLTNVDHRHGYWIKVNCNTTLTVCGGPTGCADPINIFSGWNLVSYLPMTPMAVPTAFATIMGNLQVALGYDNGGKTYLPGSPEFNTLTELDPGFGYWVRSSGPATLRYFRCGDSVERDIPAPTVSSTVALGSRFWMSLYGSAITLDGVPIAKGTPVEFVTQDNVVVGKSVYGDGILRFVPVYGADAQDAATKSFPAEGDKVFAVINGTKLYPAITWTGQGTVQKLTELYSSADGNIPRDYSLSQNFPNPFNPQTTISFGLPQASRVKLVVYNVLGQAIKTLADDNFTAGTHTALWDGTNATGTPVSSGVYFYRIEANNYIASKKMIMLK